MKEIVAEGTRYFYFTRSEPLPPSPYLGIEIRWSGYPIGEFMRKQILKAPDFRLVLVRNHFPYDPEGADSFGLYYLYWLEEIDLDDLDTKVTLGTFTNREFESAVKTYYNVTHCNNCAWQWNTLVFCSAEVYVDAPELYPKKLIIAYANVLSCPNCGIPFRIPVLKVFNKAS
ncbi:MAG: hypothetical protein K8I82_01920 [Anaerolineae bacterium]|nr:hypothetical protein [Anaerolineae bacterium]